MLRTSSILIVFTLLLIGGVDATEWSEAITITAGTQQQILVFGVHENGTDAYDSDRDEPAPPSAPGSLFEAFFRVTDSLFPGLYTDIRGTIDEKNPERIWEIRLTSKEEAAVISWNIASIPRNITPILISPENVNYDMKKVSFITIPKDEWGGRTIFIKAEYNPIPPLVADFAATTRTGTAPLTVHFSDITPGSPTAWLWTFGDGSTCSDQHPITTYTSPGRYTVTLTASDSGESTRRTKENYITVFPKGDLNRNGRVDIGDVASVAWMAAGLMTADIDADFNGDGKVDNADAARIAYYYVGFISVL